MTPRAGLLGCPIVGVSVPSSTWLRVDVSTFLDLPDIIRGLDFGWDPVPTQSLSTFQGLLGRKSQEPVAGWEGLQKS